jgi:hypothetical protein
MIFTLSRLVARAQVNTCLKTIQQMATFSSLFGVVSAKASSLSHVIEASHTGAA